MRFPSRIEFPILCAVVVVAFGLYGFFEMFEVARDSDPHGFDTSILLMFRSATDPAQPLGPIWVQEAVRDATALGSTTVLLFVVGSVLVYLMIGRRWRVAGFLFASVALGQLLSSALKLGVERPRPELVPHLTQVYTASFPSGHAMLSTVTYLTLGALAARIAPDRATKVFFLVLAILATFMVGVSRVYLGVHWPSDVLAGWSAGAAWAMVCWLVSEWALTRRRRRLERSASPRMSVEAAGD